MSGEYETKYTDQVDSVTQAIQTPELLVVDDDRAVRAVLDVALTHQGFKVWTAADGEEAVAVYRRQRERISLVLMDVCMPGLDGPQTLALLQELDPRIRICFMTGNIGEYTMDGLIGLGAMRVFIKPFQVGHVTQTLWQLAHDFESAPSRGSDAEQICASNQICEVYR